MTKTETKSAFSAYLTNMRSKYGTLSVLFVVLVLLSSLTGVFSYTRGGAQAATSSTLNFQGRLLSSSGSLVADGTYNIEFNLYTAASGGTTQWTEDYLNNASQGVTIKNGFFSVYLGSLTSFPSTINWDQEQWLGMTVRGTGSCAFGSCTPADSEMTPRFKLTAVPYAFKAGTALGVSSNNTSTASTNSGAVTVTSGNATGATSNSGSITVDVGTATGTAGALLFGTSNASALTIGRSGVTTTLQGSVSLTGAGTALSVTNDASIGGTLAVTGTSTFTGLLSANGGLTIPTGFQFTNASSTLNTAKAISDKATGGSIGSAATTVDVATTFDVTQTTGGQTLTLANPTTATSGRIVYVNNTGSASFTMYGSVIAAGKSNAFIWNGSSWVTTVSLSGSVVNTIGTIDSQTKSSDGAVISSNAVYLQTADLSFPGLVSIAAQSFNGVKTFDDGIVVTTGGVTITAGDLAVNGDNITSDSNLTVNATGYVRIGDTGTPGTANGDDDLYVESDLEVDGSFTLGSDTVTDITGSGLSVSSGALIVDATSSTGFIRNGGNSFGAAATLGTNDNNALNFETNGTTKLTVTTAGSLLFNQPSSITGAGAGESISILGGDDLSLTGAGGNVVLDGGTGLTNGSVIIGNGNASAVSLGRTGITTTNAGALTVSQLLTGNLGATISGATTSINASSNFGTNINTGTSTGTVAIGNSASTTNVLGATNINTSGTAATSIGNSGAGLTLTGSSILLNSATLQRTAAGTTTLDLVDSSNTTLALTNSGAGVLNVTVDGGATLAGNLAVNGGTITSTGNLTVDATGYVRVGDTGTPGTANGDDDLYVESDLEVDGSFILGSDSISDLTGSGLVVSSGALTVDTASGTGFIQNQFSGTQTGNFNIQSANSAQVAAVIKGAASQSVDFFQVQNSSGTKLFYIDSASKAFFDGDIVSATTGVIRTLDRTIAGNSVSFTLRSGSTVSGNTGSFTFKSGDATGGNSGSLSFDVGSSSGGTRGSISFGTGAAAPSAINIGQSGVLTTNAGALTVSQLLTGNLGATISGATTSINDTSNFNTNINTGTSTGTVAIGNSASTTNVLGATNINTSGTAATSIGNSGAALTLAGSSILFNSATLSRTAAGTTSFDLVDGSNTTLALLNSGAGVLNLTVDGNGTFAGDIAVNGGDITSSGNLTVNATGYVRIGDTGTPGVATGDDDLYVESDIEADGTLDIAGAATFGSTITVATLGSADTNTYICRNSSNQLATCTSTPLSSSLTDNVTDALDIQEGTNNYINVNTTNGSENISFGNATTNPSFSFLGSGAVNIAGNADVAGTLFAGTGDAFQVSAGGAVTAVGVNSGTGLIQGTGGLTVTGTTNINATGAGTTTIGSSAAGAIAIQSASTIGLTGTTSITGLTSGAALTVSNSTSTGNILTLNDNATTVLSVADGGAVVLQNTVDSTAAFTVKGSGGVTYFAVDTSNGQIGTLPTSAATTNSQPVTLRSGQASGSGSNSGAIIIRSGNTNDGTVGNVEIDTGSPSSGTNYGQIYIGSNFRNGGINIGTVGTNARVSTVNISTTSGNSTQTVNIGSTGNASNVVTILGGSSAGVNIQNSGTGTVAIGNATSTTTVLGAVNINTTGTAATSVGNSGATLTLAGSSILLNSATLSRTAAGTTSLDLVDGSNTTLALLNSGAGVLNLTVDGAGTFSGNLAVNGGTVTSTGNLTIDATGYVRVGDTGTPGVANGDDDLYVEGDLEADGVLNIAGAATFGSTLEVTTLGAADTSTFICRNTSNQLATCTTTPLTNSLTDNVADAFDLQEGTNNYINVNTTNGSENISFGNATTNPSFNFLGSGILNVAGNADIAGTLVAGTGDAFQVSAGGAVTAVGVNSGTGLLQGTGGLTLTGTTNINTTGTAATSIGNSSATTTITGSSILLNSATLQRTAAGTTTLDLADGANTTLAVANSGAGVANLTVDGAITAATGLTVTTGGATITGNSTVTGSFTTNTSTATDDQLALNVTTGGAGRFTGTITNTDLTAARTYTLQDNSGVVALGTAGNSLFFTTTGATNVTLPTSGTLTVNPASGSYLKQVPTATADNTITPTTNSVVALTVNGTSGTAATALSVVQSGAATGLDLTSSSTGTGQAINLTNTTGTQTAGLSIDRNGASGTTTSLLSLSNTAGTVTNGILFTGTIGTDINTASNRNLSISAAGTGDLLLNLDSDTNLQVAGTVTSTSSADLQTLNLTNQTSSGTQRGLVVTNVNDAANAVTESLVVIDNAETTANTVTDYLLISSAATDTTANAINVSDADLFNGIYLGANFARFDGVRIFEGTTGTLTIEDTSGNDLFTLADGGTTGNLTITGTTALQGATTITGGVTVNNSTANDDQIATSISTGGAGRFTGTVTNADFTAARTFTLPDQSGTFLLGATGTGNALVQVPTSNTAGTQGANVISPTAASITGLTVNGTTSTAATAVIVTQSGAATGLALTSSSTGSGQAISLTNTTGTQTAGLSIDRNGASGTTTSLLSLSNTAGTATNGILFTGTIGTDITTATNRGLSISANGSGTLTLNTSGAGTVNLGTANTTTIGIGNNTSNPSISIDSGTGSISIGTGAQNRTVSVGTGAANQTVSVGSTSGTSSLTLSSSGAISLAGSSATFTEVTGTRTVTVATRSGSNTAGSNLTVQAGTAAASGAATAGGVLTLQGGSANGASSSANGGNVVIAGGTGFGASGVKGLVVLDTTTYSAAGVQSFTASANITQANIDTYGSLLISGNTAGWVATLTDPTITTAGRVIYITNSGSVDITLAANTVGVALSITLKPASTATMYWNGTDWTAAGASSSTDLQAAYNNTAASSGNAEIVLSNTGTGGLTVRNGTSTAEITGGLLEVQTAIGSNLFTVNSNTTEYANNGGAESSTFTMWAAAPAGGTVSRYTTTGTNIATGVGSTFVDATATANTGAKNTLSTTLTQNLKYKVSYTVRHTSTTLSFSTLDTIYSSDGTSTTATCASGSTAYYNVWTRIDCTFTATSVGASNSIIIRHSDAVDHDFYIDNLSVTVSADVNHAADGTADVAASMGSTSTFNWVAINTATVAQTTSVLYDTSGAVSVTTSGTAGRGVFNRLTNNIAPSISTTYRVSFYARGDGTNTATLAVAYTPDNNTSSVSCQDYNTQVAVAGTYTLISCYFTTSATAVTNAQLRITQSAGSSTVFYIDALNVNLNSSTSNNVQIGGANKGGPTTLFTLDRSNGAPIAANNDAYLGSMYYDTSTGRIQCYEADGWGACGAAPDNIVNLNPEYAGAVLNGTGVGTMTADFCSNQAGVLSVNSTLCSSGQAKNYYRWTSPQATTQTYSIYVTYQLPSTFNGFSSDDTVQLVGRVDSTTNASVTYEMYKSVSGAVTQCGSSETDVITGGGGSANTWYSYGINGNESTGCSFTSSAASGFVIFKINLKAKSSANAYVSTLSFTTTGR